MAKGIETLAGPVSENDIIMRENEAPMGAAALMNKQVRKSVPGFYKLPSQKDDTPGFMKAAKAGVDQNMAQMDTISTMAGALMREGVDTRQMNPDQIIMLYEQMMGSVGDRDQFGITDATDALNDMAPDGEKLAYINPEEAGILAMLGGAGEMTPQGIPSFALKFGAGDDRRSSYIAGRSGGKQVERKQSSGSNTQTDRGGGSSDAFEAGRQERERKQRFDTGTETKAEAEQARNIARITGKDPNESIKQFRKDVITADNPLEVLKSDANSKKILDLIKDYEPLTDNVSFPGLIGIFDAISKGQAFKKKSERLTRKDKDGKDTDEMTKEGFMEKLGDIPGGRDTFFNLIKRYDPQNYYKVVDPQTTGEIEDLSKFDLQKLGNSKEDRRFSQRVMEAREIMSQKRGRDNAEQGGGFTQPTMPGDTSTVTPSEDAYKFNVGGTMPYTDDILTGGEEMQVPVGRRMQLAKTGAMKTKPQTMQELLALATKGGGFNQLEDFNNYIKRRRKFLGEEEPEYFDEDGNVIMSGMGV